MGSTQDQNSTHIKDANGKPNKKLYGNTTQNDSG
jgi:hypothetical protein